MGGSSALSPKRTLSPKGHARYFGARTLGAAAEYPPISSPVASVRCVYVLSTPILQKERTDPYEEEFPPELDTHTVADRCRSLGLLVRSNEEGTCDSQDRYETDSVTSADHVSDAFDGSEMGNSGPGGWGG